MKFKFASPPASNRDADQGETADQRAPLTPPRGNGPAQDSQRFAQDSHAENRMDKGDSRDSQDSHGSCAACTPEDVAELDALIVRLAELEAPWLGGYLPVIQGARRRMAPIHVAEALSQFRQWVAEAEARTNLNP